VANTEFKVSDSAFQNKFTELIKPGSGTNDLAVFAAKRGKSGFNVRPLIIDYMILQEIVGDAVPAEFTVPVHWFDTVCTRSLLTQPPVVAFVGGENGQFVEIVFDQLPSDLRITRLCHK